MSRKGVVGAIALVILAGCLPVWAQRDSDSSRAERANRALTRWLDQDVAYIIVQEEKNAFKALSTDEERAQFIEQFWLRRDPSPDTIENEYREEHYRRIAYTNERFSSGRPGWMSDRGRIYVIHGPPTSIDQNRMGGTYQRTLEEGGGTTSVIAFEKWYYRYIEGIGNAVEFEFIDPTYTGEYRLAMHPYEKEMAYMPGVGLTLEEEMADEDDQGRLRMERLQGGYQGRDIGGGSQFDRLELWAKAFNPPEIKFKDLETIVTTKLSFNLLPFDVRTDFVRVTTDTVLTPITVVIQNKDITYQDIQGIHEATLHLFGQVTGINGRVAQTFEDTITLATPEALFRDSLERHSIYQKVIPLSPGLYKIDLVIKDIHSNNVGSINQRLAVPRFPDEQLSASSLILADLIEPLPPRQVGSGPFVLGSLKVRPSVYLEFLQSSELKYWLQVYNLQIDEELLKPSATVETLITRDGQEVQKIVENSDELSGAAQQMTLQKTIPLADFEPGEYSIQVRVIDNLSGDVISQSSQFVVEEALIASGGGL